jgi:hypothetical protein
MVLDHDVEEFPTGNAYKILKYEGSRLNQDEPDMVSVQMPFELQLQLTTDAFEMYRCKYDGHARSFGGD